VSHMPNGAYLCAYSWVWGNVVEMRSAVRRAVPWLPWLNDTR
jgi:hypothetical protein